MAPIQKKMIEPTLLTEAEVCVWHVHGIVSVGHWDRVWEGVCVCVSLWGIATECGRVCVSLWDRVWEGVCVSVGQSVGGCVCLCGTECGRVCVSLWGRVWEGVCVSVGQSVGGCVCLCGAECGRVCVSLWDRVWEGVCVSVGQSVGGCVCLCGAECGRVCVSLQIGWLNSYHSTVVETVGAYLREAGKDVAYRWLLRETEPLG